MSTSAGLQVAVGIPANLVFKVSEVDSQRPQYDPESGQQTSMLDYKQVTISAFGKELKLPEDKQLVRKDRPELGFRTEMMLHWWLEEHKFDYDLIQYHHSDNGYYSQPTGILGISVVEDCPNLAEIELDVVKRKLFLVQRLLTKAGAQDVTKAKLYAHAYLC